MRDARDEARLLATLPAWRRLLRDAHAAAAAPHGMHAFAQLMHYIWYVAGDLRFHDFRGKLLEHVPDAQETVMTIAEELLQQGREQGRAQGLEQGRAQGIEQGRAQGIEQGRAQGIEQGRRLSAAETLRKLLALKFGPVTPELEVQISTASLAQLERYVERILTSDAAAKVFED